MGGNGRLRKHSNLSCFLRRSMPSMAARELPTVFPRDTDLHGDGKDNVKNFHIADLWDNYYEWSVCGLGVPVLLSNGESIVQYYVPYLSAIQIFTSKFHPLPRNKISEDSESDSWSDDSEDEKMSRWDGVSEDSSVDQDNSWPSKYRLGHLYLQYIERSPPHIRIPLIDKVKELARDYPGLIYFKSVDISPASWMSILWYPIYQIPTRSVKDLSACFLTYHTISSSFQDDIPDILDNTAYFACSDKKVKEINDSKRSISLPPFGLASYKMHGNLWMNPESADQETIMTLYNAADSWLKQLRFQHHDFNYFSSHSM